MASDDLKFLERLKKIEGQLERLANDFFISDSFVEATYGSLWRPPTDVYETDAHVVVRMEAPGLHPEDISLTLHTDTLVIRAVRRDPRTDAKSVYHQLEIHYGFFERVVPLPKNIRHEDAEGSYVDGFLIIIIPKSEEVVELTEIVHLRI
jgi:HSP20 family protein